ncbi:MAG TPA: peptidoglycan DD-metalloendopeptidase family protein [Xanthobacteraceae bacterium]
MNFPIEFLRSARPRVIVLTLVAIGAAGCSAESTRFGEQPYAARSAQGEVTGSIPSGQAAPVGRVEQRPLSQASQLPPPPLPAHSAPVASTVVAGGGRGMASYTPSAAPYNPPVTPVAYSPPPNPVAYNPPPNPVAYNPPPSPPTYSTASYNSAPAAAPTTEITGSVAAPNSLVRKPAPSRQWNWDGGTAVTVAQGETVESIARRHGVPVSAIMEANNLASPNTIQVGQRLVIPRYAPTLAAAAPVPPAPTHTAPPVAAPAAPRPMLASVSSPPKAAPPVTTSASPPTAGGANSSVHVVASGETLTKIAHQYGKSVADIAKANNIPPYSKVSIGDRLYIPGVRISSARPETERVAAAPAPPPAKVASNAAPAQSVSVVTPAADTPSSDTPAKTADATPGFRWPARGRIIAGFGPKPNGQQNDGIDVAVPENTPIKAAEDGVVAYAGSELKGYGNLVLVRHPNGYVTAYAHAKELLVKRGDPIKRGEVIAKSGQTGLVDVPELHFEVRKGTVPVDPMPFLSGV